MFFDCVFMVQHFCLYKDSNSDLGNNKKDKDEAIDRLINSSNVRESDIKE